MPIHNRAVVINPPTSMPPCHPDTKAPLHPVVYSYTERTPLWEYPHNNDASNKRNKKLRGPKIAVEAVAVGPPEFISRTFPDLAKAGSVEVFQTEIMGVIVRFLWQRVRQYYVRQFRQYCLLLFTFVFGIFCDLWVHEQKDYLKLYGKELMFADALMQDHSQSPFPLLIIVSRMSLFISNILAVLFLSREVRQMKVHGLQDYFDSGWNRLELSGYFFVTLTNFWYLFLLPWKNVVISISIMVLICTTMAHLRGFAKYSPIITTFLQIVNDMGAFLRIIFLLWCGTL